MLLFLEQAEREGPKVEVFIIGGTHRPSNSTIHRFIFGLRRMYASLTSVCLHTAARPAENRRGPAGPTHA